MAQAASTVMYHFRTRENLLAAASAQLAFELADQAREHYKEAAEVAPPDPLDVTELHIPEMVDMLASL